MNLLACGFAFSLCVLGSALAQEPDNGLKLSDILAKGAAQVSKDDLQALLPDANVAVVGRGGSTKYWKNSADGTFIASTDSRSKSVAGKASTGRGTWRIGDNATYCVVIEWNKHTEQWCRFLFKAGDTYFGVKSVEDQAGSAYAISFSK